jgi:hypothetical protein
MSQEENVAAEEPQEVVQPEELVSDDVSSEIPPEPAPGSQEYNWQQARNEIRRRDEEVRELRQMLEAMRNPPPAPPTEEEYSLAADDLAEGRHIQHLEKKIENLLQKMKNEEVPSKLKARFPDIDDVVTVENIERLKKEEPELLGSIYANPDLYARGVAAYKLVKKSSPAPDPYANEKAAIESNRTRPGSGNAAARQSPLAEADRFAGGLTPQLKKQLLAEMEEASRRY